MPPLIISSFSHSDVSRNSEISLQCYLRSGDSLPSQQGSKDGQGDDVMGMGDIYLGGIKFVPDFGNQVGNCARSGSQSARR
jgi:serum/glucocorticoid-regulated kinase 2